MVWGFVYAPFVGLLSGCPIPDYSQLAETEGPTCSERVIAVAHDPSRDRCGIGFADDEVTARERALADCEGECIVSDKDVVGAGRCMAVAMGVSGDPETTNFVYKYSIKRERCDGSGDAIASALEACTEVDPTSVACRLSCHRCDDGES